MLNEKIKEYIKGHLDNPTEEDMHVYVRCMEDAGLEFDYQKNTFTRGNIEEDALRELKEQAFNNFLEKNRALERAILKVYTVLTPDQILTALNKPIGAYVNPLKVIPTKELYFADLPKAFPFFSDFLKVQEIKRFAFDEVDQLLFINIGISSFLRVDLKENRKESFKFQYDPVWGSAGAYVSDVYFVQKEALDAINSKKFRGSTIEKIMLFCGESFKHKGVFITYDEVIKK